MKFIIFACLVASAACRPQYDYNAPGLRSDSGSRRSEDFIPILRSDIEFPDSEGRYRVDTETGDAIFRSESGAPTGPDGAIEKSGSVRFTFPTGEEFELTYVADAAGGYQPQSSWLPVAPAFPHEIPQFVLDQIAKAAEEDAAAARANAQQSTRSEGQRFSGYN
ncbi:Cuticle Protein CPR RR Uncl [Hyalella azteca]|uniref:Cuticle Protein CPR RR Uncl n=1 Tax=Hyalella azteca TaxID=294128 RepID=A0A6A0GYU9_HYAAZ|nr:cuticle protein AMP1B-like isoform X1 [Hyalella azteca]KAA0192157.1 Cuticle Protein CPR RR Uncl [Hyalella azteca]